MCIQRPEPLGDRGRAHHVDEEEEASLGVRPAILSEQKRHERAVTDETRSLKHRHYDGNGYEREANRTFKALLSGKYRRPYAERRFFLFVDVVGSTAIAERLGALEAHRFLAAVFSAVAEPVELCRGEIYQYVGDEIVITWVEADGVADARALRCLFAMRAALAADASQFVQRFGVRPELRAALHLGEVIAGEVGTVRRAIVFHGDVMNTTGCLEQATREVGCLFIASAEALRPIDPPPEIRTHDLGALALRGRVQPIHAFCVEYSDGNV